MKIRRADEGDIKEILKLLEEVLSIHAKLRPDIFIEGTTKYTHEELSKMVHDNVNPIFVADIDGKVAGYIFCETKTTLGSEHIRAEKELYIDDLCVDEAYRGKGVAKELLDYVKKFAATNKFDTLTLNVWAGNERAEKFYEKHGFFARKTLMELKVNK